MQPSARYAIDRLTTTNDEAQPTHFTNKGKANCAAHSAGICSVLVSLCTVRKPELIDMNSLLQSFIPRIEASAEGRRDIFSNDDEFQNDIRQCLCSELCHISKYSDVCVQMLGDANEIIVRTFVGSITNANVLNIFPSINHDIMMEVGGAQSKEKEEQLLFRATKKSATFSRLDGQSPDADGVGLHRRTGDYFDTPGATYMSSHVWTFCADLGLLLEAIAKHKPFGEGNLLNRMSSALQENDSDLDPYVRNICSDTLKSLSEVSLERECLKRIMKLRSMLSACLQTTSDASGNTYENAPHRIRMVSNIVSSLTSGLLLEMSCIAKGVDYYGRNPSSTQPYIHAKTRALLCAYGNFMIPTLSWLLSQPTLIDASPDQAVFIFRFVILPCLRSRGLDVSQTLLEAASKRNLARGKCTISFECGLQVWIDLS